MPRSFEIVCESAASVESIHATFGRADYWADRLAGDAASTLDSLTVDVDGTVDVHITQYLGRQMLPGLIAKAIPGDLKLQYRETWRSAGDGRVRGAVDVSAAGGFGSSRAENWLAAAGHVSQLRSSVSVEVKIPLVGGQLEKSIGAGLTKSIPATLSYTTTWIAEHG
ncbi:DUF2505 domain-containing protein [Mycolicibacterium aichiense]|uniref:Uncharacterized protein n=1 Tax=Mycolicibacterium aichiense TaxID=1799 RepID=A0AAD1ME17_9MYCO|nr:DUF2505 domain-containing protein [Mycolicibacterium aichiense]MCV7019250.1 DUF2505 domain-containing protein [Mycolicibacterium aichiense]BBX09165.1 hypothetical protein MAIC_39680 [Mycolicibacterium aichiense]SUA13737.1 Protein of uncharacterised function (DUF2505) [Mycolicibacterium aichiense]